MSPFEKPKSYLDILRETLGELEHDQEDLRQLPDDEREDALSHYRTLTHDSLRELKKSDPDHATEAEEIKNSITRILKSLEK